MSDTEIIAELVNIWKNYNYTIAPDEVFTRAIDAIIQTSKEHKE